LDVKGNAYYLISYELGEDCETCDGFVMYTYGVLENVEIIKEITSGEVENQELE